MKIYLSLRISVVISLFLAISLAQAQEKTLLVASFSHEAVGNGIPQGWEVKEWKGKADINVVMDGDEPVLWLKSNGTSTALYKEVTVDIRDLPYLNWRWKVTRLPDGGDVRKRAKDDQAAQVYVIFPMNGLLSKINSILPARLPDIDIDSKIKARAVGYIWDSSAPQGLDITSRKSSKVRYVVVKGGKAGLGQWHTEKRNIYEDYKRLFGEEPPKAGRIAVMIDSDDTKSLAECFIGEIYLSRE